MNTPTPAQLIRIEAEALLRLAERLENGMAALFSRAVELVMECGRRRGRVVVTGIGKSGIIAQKLVATFNSTGTPALFLHPAEAIHGDLGMLARGDLVLALSSSGETEEILRLLPTLKRMGDGLISFCCAARPIVCSPIRSARWLPAIADAKSSAALDVPTFTRTTVGKQSRRQTRRESRAVGSY